MRRIIFFCLIAFALFAISLIGQEKFTLTTPEVKSTPEYRLDQFFFKLDNPATATVDEGLMTINLLGVNDELVTCRYTSATNPTATFLNNALQKANLSTAYAGNATTGSLKYRICHRLVVMGESTAICGKTLAGSCTGTVP